MDRVLKDIYSENNNFANIPATICKMLDVDWDGPALSFAKELGRANHVVLIVLDAFGWHQFIKFKESHSIFDSSKYNFSEHKLLSQFPSTTAAHITTLFTGLPVYDHGIYEFRYFDKKLNEVLVPFRDSKVENYERVDIDLPPEDYLPKSKIFPTLSSQGVDVRISGLHDLSSKYNLFFAENDYMQHDEYRNFIDGLIGVKNNLEKQGQNKSYDYFYYYWIDELCHIYGPDSEITEATVELLLSSIEKLLLSKVKLPNTKVIITADHGHSDVSIPDKSFYINEDERLMQMLDRDQNDCVHIVGSMRDAFLKIKPGMIEEANNYLSEKLKDFADVKTPKELEEIGLLRNIDQMDYCDLVILPYQGNAVWWSVNDKFRDTVKRGSHGGNTLQEMEIPFLVYNF